MTAKPYVAFRELKNGDEYLISRLGSDDNTLIYSVDDTKTKLDPSLLLQLVIVGDGDEKIRRREVYTVEQMAKYDRYNNFRKDFFKTLNRERRKFKRNRENRGIVPQLPESIEEIANRLASRYFKQD